MKPHPRLRILSACLLAAAALTAQAAPPPASTPITDCVDLGADRQIARGDNNKFFVRDGEANYRVSFQSSCGSISYAPRIWISTDGTDNRLCPQGTRVNTGKDACRVAKVDSITPEEFDRKARAAR